MPSRKRKAVEEETHDTVAPEEPDTSIDPYEELDVPHDASADDIKKAYRKAALKNHPDKVPPPQQAAAKTTFQRLALAYGILSDPRRRSRYDATGSTSEALLDADDDFDWLSFYREQFRDIVTEDTITSFSKKYKGSDEERRDVLEAYQEHSGNMNKLYNSVMLANVLDDDERFRTIIDEAIEAKEVPAYEAYTKETQKSKDNRITTAKKAAAAAEKLGEEIKAKAKAKAEGKEKMGRNGAANGEGDLFAMIQQRQKERGGAFLDDLAAKYSTENGGRKKGGKKKVVVEEPPEEAFEANRKRGRKG